MKTDAQMYTKEGRSQEKQPLWAGRERLSLELWSSGQRSKYREEGPHLGLRAQCKGVCSSGRQLRGLRDSSSAWFYWMLESQGRSLHLFKYLLPEWEGKLPPKQTETNLLENRVRTSLDSTCTHRGSRLTGEKEGTCQSHDMATLLLHMSLQPCSSEPLLTLLGQTEWRVYKVDCIFLNLYIHSMLLVAIQTPI